MTNKERAYNLRDEIPDISYAEIARRLGISRQAVWIWFQQLSIDLELYERKGPEWWSLNRGFCGHCGNPTNGTDTCRQCEKSGHNIKILRDRGACQACGRDGTD